MSSSFLLHCLLNIRFFNSFLNSTWGTGPEQNMQQYINMDPKLAHIFYNIIFQINITQTVRKMSTIIQFALFTTNEGYKFNRLQLIISLS